jgi:hypothetical protein
MPGRNEFYEDLALWSTLSVGRNQRNDVKRQIWQRFLDDLCYLCDTEPGGRTTVSIAVSEFEGGQCYWITANGGSQKAVGQLTLILEQLQKIRDPCVDHEEIKDKILFAGIRRSSMKVRNYLKELRRYIRVIETRISHPKGERNFSARSNLLTDICAFSSNFPRAPTVGDLRRYFNCSLSFTVQPRLP